MIELVDGVAVMRPRPRYRLLTRRADGAEAEAQSESLDALLDFQRQLAALDYPLVRLEPL